MNEDWREELLGLIRLYCVVHKVSPCTAGHRLANNPNFVKNLESGKTITVETYLKVMKSLGE